MGHYDGRGPTAPYVPANTKRRRTGPFTAVCHPVSCRRSTHRPIWGQGMSSGSFARRLATFLLEWAISFAPGDTIEWGNAVLGELHQVDGDWSALLWAIGGASMLLKHALVAIVFPGRNHPLSTSR